MPADLQKLVGVMTGSADLSSVMQTGREGRNSFRASTRSIRALEDRQMAEWLALAERREWDTLGRVIAETKHCHSVASLTLLRRLLDDPENATRTQAYQLLNLLMTKCSAMAPQLAWTYFKGIVARYSGLTELYGIRDPGLLNIAAKGAKLEGESIHNLLPRFAHAWPFVHDSLAAADADHLLAILYEAGIARWDDRPNVTATDHENVDRALEAALAWSATRGTQASHEHLVNTLSFLGYLTPRIVLQWIESRQGRALSLHDVLTLHAMVSRPSGRYHRAIVESPRIAEAVQGAIATSTNSHDRKMWSRIAVLLTTPFLSLS